MNFRSLFIDYLMYAILPFSIISLLMVSPIALFKKTPFFLSTPAAYIIYFKNWNQELNIVN